MEQSHLAQYEVVTVHNGTPVIPALKRSQMLLNGHVGSMCSSSSDLTCDHLMVIMLMMTH